MATVPQPRRGEVWQIRFDPSIGAEIRPEDPGPWVQIGTLHALKGRAGYKKALESLRVAVEKGFADVKALEGEAAFAELRQEAEFREIVGRMAARE